MPLLLREPLLPTPRLLLPLSSLLLPQSLRLPLLTQLPLVVLPLLLLMGRAVGRQL